VDPTILGRAAATLAVLLASLGLVTWRQSRALETLAEWDQLRRTTLVARAQVLDLERDIETLTSRARVVPEARERLGMHTPEGPELVILPAEPGS
jgi:cell division protein FtsL